MIINDVPKICNPNSSQDIKTKDKSTSLPLEMHGPIPYLPVSKPTQNDINYLPWVKLTSDEVEWDPHYIFNEGKTNIYPYLEDDFEISYNIQGLRTLETAISKHESTIAAMTLSYSGKYSADKLANLWGIGLKAAERTLKFTTQLSTRYLKNKIHRRVRTRMHQRRYRHLQGHLSRFSTDTFESSVKSLRGNLYFQLFCNSGAFTKAYPLKGTERGTPITQ